MYREGLPYKLSIQELEADVGGESSASIHQPHLEHSVDQSSVSANRVSPSASKRALKGERRKGNSLSVVEEDEEVGQAKQGSQPLGRTQQFPRRAFPFPLPQRHFVLSSPPSSTPQSPEVDE